MLINSTSALIKSTRDYRRHSKKSGIAGTIMRKIARFRQRFWSMITHSDIVPGADLGDGIRLPHPNGVVIHENAVIGSNTMIMQQVTIGITADGGPPKIGSDVYIGAGAKILGKICIGDGARIGANAVVLSDIPPYTTAVGAPAKIVERRSRQMGPGTIQTP